MKHLFYLSIILLLSSCSYKISRTGYKIDKSAYTANCDIVIKKNAVIDDSMEKLGEVRLKDSGFTMSCSEETAIELLRKEGCALNANLINITNEQRIDMLSSCYRCTAEFYRVKTDSTLTTDKQFSIERVQARSQSDKKKGAVIIVIAVVVGVVIGIAAAL